MEIIEPLLEETQCPQQNLNDKEQQILESIIEGSYTDLKRLKQILDDCKELNKPLDERRWDKSKLLQCLRRLQLNPKVINGIQSSLSVKITLLNTLKNASDRSVYIQALPVSTAADEGPQSSHPKHKASGGFDAR